MECKKAIEELEAKFCTKKITATDFVFAITDVHKKFGDTINFYLHKRIYMLACKEVFNV